MAVKKYTPIQIALPAHLAKFVSVSQQKDGLVFYQNLEEFSLRMVRLLYTKTEIQAFEKDFFTIKEKQYITIQVRKGSYTKLNEFDFGEEMKLAELFPLVIKTLFARELENWVKAVKYCHPKTQTNHIVQSFLNCYSITEDDYAFTNALMIWTRYKEKQRVQD